VTSPSLQRAWLLMGPGWSAPSGLDPTGAVQGKGKAFANRNHVRFERLGQLVSEPRKFLRARLLRARSGDCRAVSVGTSPAHAALHEADLLIEEPHFSGALNRVDYAAFYVARAVLAIRDLDSSRHSGVIALFQEHFVLRACFPRHHRPMPVSASTRVAGCTHASPVMSGYPVCLSLTTQSARGE
jgi:hypothetical protein